MLLMGDDRRMTQPPKTRAVGLPATAYRIVVTGALDPAWSDRVSGMEVMVRQDGDGGTTTELRGRLADEAALMGVIDRLYSYGAHLLCVECLAHRDGDEEAIPLDP